MPFHPALRCIRPCPIPSRPRDNALNQISPSIHQFDTFQPHRQLSTSRPPTTKTSSSPDGTFCRESFRSGWVGGWVVFHPATGGRGLIPTPIMQPRPNPKPNPVPQDPGSELVMSWRGFPGGFFSGCGVCGNGRIPNAVPCCAGSGGCVLGGG